VSPVPPSVQQAGSGTCLHGRRLGGRRSAERAVKELLVSEPVPQFAFEPAYRHEVLGGAGVFMRAARQWGEQPGGQVGQSDDLGGGQVGGAFETDYDKPSWRPKALSRSSAARNWRSGSAAGFKIRSRWRDRRASSVTSASMAFCVFDRPSRRFC
jgi:hypothetical protein